jgi:4-amino-4-deoxy-L-arabinose transferase-like glycosyltransferase
MAMSETLYSRVREWRSGKWDIVFLLLVSFTIKAVLLFSGDIINLDGVRYIDAARQFAEGNFPEALRIDWMPFYSLLIAGFHFLIRDWVLAGRLISLFSMALALIPLYLLTRDLFNEKAAFWAGLAFALAPAFNEQSIELIRDPLFFFFAGWAVYFGWRALRTGGMMLFFSLASLSTILALFCRLEAILLPVVFLSVLAVLAIKNRAERGWLLKGAAVLAGLPLALGLLLAGGVLLVAGSGPADSTRTAKLTGKLKQAVTVNSLAYYKRKVDKGVFENYRSRYRKLKELERTLPGWGSHNNLLATTRHYLPLIYLLSALETMARNLYPLFVLPLLAGFRKHPVLQRGHWFVLLLSGAYFLMAYYFLFTHDWISSRYILMPAFLVFPWVGRGLERIHLRISECRWPRLAMVLFLLAFCIAPACKSAEGLRGPGRGDAIRVAGQWLAGQPDLEKAVIACSDPRLRFYSSEKMTFLRAMEKSSVARNVRKMESVAFSGKADLLVVEVSRKNRRLMPEFEHFSFLKEFVGEKNDVLIYRRIMQPLPQKSQFQKS